MVEMSVCASYRLPHSVFLGWDKDDRDKAIAWQLRQAATCPGCGTRAEEWDEKRGGNNHAYVAEQQRCRGCEVRELGEAAKAKDDAGRGVSVVLKPNPHIDE